MSLVVIAVVLGAFGQSGQVSRHSALFKEQVEMKHENATKMMLKHKEGSQKAGDMDQRLQAFLRTRDSAGLGLGDVRDEGRSSLGEPVVCMSDGAQAKARKRRRSRDSDA